jgi:hypothetical protein
VPPRLNHYPCKSRPKPIGSISNCGERTFLCIAAEHKLRRFDVAESSRNSRSTEPAAFHSQFSVWALQTVKISRLQCRGQCRATLLHIYDSAERDSYKRQSPRPHMFASSRPQERHGYLSPSAKRTLPVESSSPPAERLGLDRKDNGDLYQPESYRLRTLLRTFGSRLP